jgi:hypothetical protein
MSVSVAAAAQSTNGFAAMLLLGISSALPIGQRVRTYSTLAAVAADFGTNCEEYNAASVYFQQSPQPGTLLIGRRFNVAVPGELLGSSAPDSTLADYAGIAAGSLTLTVDGTAVNLTGIVLTGVANLSAVAAAVQTKLVAVKAGSTCIWTGTQFIIRSGTTGVASSVGFSTASGVGTDLGTMMGLTAAVGAISTQGAAVEAIADTLNAIQALNATGWFYLAFTKEILPADILNAAAWAQANNVMFGYTVQDGTAFNTVPAQSTSAMLASLGYSNTVSQYDNNDPYAVVSIFARSATVDFDQPNSTITLKFKQEPGVSPVTLTETQRLALEANNVNYYTYFGQNKMIAEGVVANGRFIDEVVGLAWLQWAVQSDVFAFEYAVTTKIAQTDRGVSKIRQVITKRLDSAVDNGLLAPGTWNTTDVTGADGTTVVSTGDFVKNGYIVYAAPVSSQSQVKRSARIYDLFTVVAKGAGAIQGVGIALTFES